MDYNESIAIENFIDFCDEMQIANEGFSLQNAIESIINTLTRFVEFFRRLVLQFQMKLRGNKWIVVPKDQAKFLLDSSAGVMKIAAMDYIDDDDVEKITNLWNESKSLIAKDKARMKSNGGIDGGINYIPANHIYKELISESKIVTDALKTAKTTRLRIGSMKVNNANNEYDKDIETGEKYIAHLNNVIKVVRIVIDIDKTFLSYKFVNEKDVKYND